MTSAKTIEARNGGRLAFRDVYRDYEATAQRHSKLALAPDQFGANLNKLCDGTSVGAREVGYASRTKQSARLGTMSRAKRDQP